MGLIRNVFRRLGAPVPSRPASPRSWIAVGLVSLLLWWFGAGWLIPYVAPFFGSTPAPVQAPLQPGMVEPAEAVSDGPRGERYGWAGPQAAAAARAQLVAEIQPFRYEPHEWTAVAGKRVVLWPFTRVAAGKDPPNIPQPVGDCVSRGWSHGCEFAQAVHLYFTGGEFWRVYPPYLYGTSRVQVGGGRLSGDGSTGAWAAAAVERYGVLPWTDDLPAYTAANIRAWGRSGPPPAALEKGKRNKAQTRSITTFADAVVAISHGWPVPVCSSQGFQSIVTAHERIEGRASGTWYHCMVFCGFDTRDGQEGLYCLNSWGPNAHAPCTQYATLDGAPCGGFWVPRSIVERMLAERDSYSVSFDGFSRPQSPVLEAFEIHVKP